MVTNLIFSESSTNFYNPRLKSVSVRYAEENTFHNINSSTNKRADQVANEIDSHQQHLLNHFPARPVAARGGWVEAFSLGRLLYFGKISGSSDQTIFDY